MKNLTYHHQIIIKNNLIILNDSIILDNLINTQYLFIIKFYIQLKYQNLKIC